MPITLETQKLTFTSLNLEQGLEKEAYSIEDLFCGIASPQF